MYLVITNFPGDTYITNHKTVEEAMEEYRERLSYTFKNVLIVAKVVDVDLCQRKAMMAKIMITSEGDESVGIFGGLAEIELGVPLEDLDAEFQSYIIDTFAELFSEVWGEPATVNFMGEEGR